METTNYIKKLEADNIFLKSKIADISLQEELNKNFISMRTKEGLRLRKEKGLKVGRPEGSGIKLKGKEKEIKKLLENKVSVSAIARMYDVNRATVSKFITESIKNKKATKKKEGEREKMLLVSVRLKKEKYEEVKKASEELGVNNNEFIRIAVHKYLKEYKTAF